MSSPIRLTMPAEAIPPHLRQYFRPADGCGKCHICVMVDVFRLVRRILRKDGVCFINYGDCYACAPNGRKAADIESDDRTFRDKPFSTATNGRRNTQGGAQIAGEGRFKSINLKTKDLVMMAYRLAIALQADGWYVRSAITICKNNPMPESVQDRPTQATEMLFLLTKSERYFMDMDAIREPHTEPWRSTGKPESRGMKDVENGVNGGFGLDGVRPREYNAAGRNKRNWWLVNSMPMKDAHYAAFSEKLVEPCILAGTSERGVCPDCGAPWERMTENAGEYQAHWAPGTQKKQKTLDEGRVTSGGVMETGMVKLKQTTGWRPTCAHQHTEDQLLPAVVLDPFAGSGTVSRVASRLGRRSIGIELSEEYVEKIARKRTSQGSLGL